MPKPLLLLLMALWLNSCVGSGRDFVLHMHRDDRKQLQAFIREQRAQREVARQHLQGQARTTEYQRIETSSNARIDSLLNTRYQARRFHRSRPGVEHQLGFGPKHQVEPNPGALEALERF